VSRFPSHAGITATPVAANALGWSIGIMVPPGLPAGVVPK
jgi:hypothetical protein